MAAGGLEITVRFLHILFGAAWVGGVLFNMHAVAMGLRKAPREVAGPAMGIVGARGISFFAASGVLTILFGMWNQWLIARELRYEGGTWNTLLGASFGIAVAVIVISFAVIVPTFRRLQALAPKGPPPAGAPAGPPPEVLALQKRMMTASLANVALLLLAVLFMAWATALRTQAFPA